MTDHECSYYCQRPACVLAQRDELRDGHGAGNQTPPHVDAIDASTGRVDSQPGNGRKPAQRLTLAQATAPRQIWLQISDDSSDYGEKFPINGEVTWCQDSVLECQVRYVRADLAKAKP